MPDLTLAAIDGTDTLDLTDVNSPVFVMAGAKGLDMPVPAIMSDVSPFLAGELIRSVRDGAREVFLPLLLRADTQADLWAARSRLFTILRPPDRAAGCRLTAVDPATGTGRYLDVVYVNGAEGDLAVGSYGTVWQKLGVTLRAADPYWYDETGQSVSYTDSSAATWFTIFPLTLGPTQILSGETVAGTINLIANPSAEVSLNGWGSLGGAGDPDLTQDTSRALYGTSSVRYAWPTYGSAGGNAGYSPTGLTIAETYTASAWVWVPTGHPPVKLTAFFIGSGSASTLFDTWQRITVTFAATTTNPYLYVESTTATTLGHLVWVDGFQCELGAAATSYCDGDQPGCYWTAVAHASTSVREAAYAGSTLDVAGDTQTWPVWTITGPGSSLTVIHIGQDRRFGLTGDIPAGTTVTIDTRPRQQAVYDSGGSNLFGRLTAGFSFFPLDAGRNDLSVALTGSSADSAITVEYTPRWAAA